MGKWMGNEWEPDSYREAVRTVLEAVALTVVLLWIAPFFSIAVPGVVFSRDTAIAVLACITRIPDALAIIRDERERTAAEKKAFEQFATRISDLDVAEPRPAPAEAGIALTGTGTASTSGLEEVRTAYRDTVMAVPHYEEEYGESVQENMAAEFGTSLALIVTNGDALTPQLQSALVEASNAAHRERASLLRELDREIDALTDIRRRLHGVSEVTERLAKSQLGRRSFEEAAHAERRLRDLERDCEQVLHDRQDRLQERCSHGGIRLQEYLYTTCPWTFPILGDALDCLSRVHDAERRIVRTVTRRP